MEISGSLVKGPTELKTLAEHANEGKSSQKRDFSFQVHVEIPPIPEEISQVLQAFGPLLGEALRRTIKEDDQQEQKYIQKQIDQAIQDHREAIEELKIAKQNNLREEIKQLEKELGANEQRFRKIQEEKAQQLRREGAKEAQQSRENYQQIIQEKENEKKKIKNWINNLLHRTSKDPKTVAKELTPQFIDEWEERIKQRKMEVEERIKQRKMEVEEQIQQRQREEEDRIQRDREEYEQSTQRLEREQKVSLQKEIANLEKNLKNHLEASIQKALERRLAGLRASFVRDGINSLELDKKDVAASHADGSSDLPGKEVPLVPKTQEKEEDFPADRRFFTAGCRSLDPKSEAHSSERPGVNLSDHRCRPITPLLLALSKQLLRKIEESKKKAEETLRLVEEDFCPTSGNEDDLEMKAYMKVHEEDYLETMGQVLTHQAEMQIMHEILEEEAKALQKLAPQSVSAKLGKSLSDQIFRACQEGWDLWSRVKNQAEGPWIPSDWKDAIVEPWSNLSDWKKAIAGWKKAIAGPGRLAQVRCPESKTIAAREKLFQELLLLISQSPAEIAKEILTGDGSLSEPEEVPSASHKEKEKKVHLRLTPAHRAFLEGAEALLETFCEPLLLRIAQWERELKELFHFVKQSIPPEYLSSGGEKLVKEETVRYLEKKSSFFDHKAQEIQNALLDGIQQLEQFARQKYQVKKLPGLKDTTFTFQKKILSRNDAVKNLWAQVKQRVLTPCNQETREKAEDFGILFNERLTVIKQLLYDLPKIKQMRQEQIQYAVTVFSPTERAFLAKAKVELEASTQQIIQKIEENKKMALEAVHRVGALFPLVNADKDEDYLDMQKIERYKETYLDLMKHAYTQEMEVSVLYGIFVDQRIELEQSAIGKYPAIRSYLRQVIFPTELLLSHVSEAKKLWDNVRSQAEKFWTQAELKAIGPNFSPYGLFSPEGQAAAERLYQELRPKFKPTPSQLEALDKRIAEILNEEEDPHVLSQHTTAHETGGSPAIFRGESP